MKNKFMIIEFLRDNVVIIIAIIPGIASSIALWFNKKTHDKEIRNQNYIIVENLDQEFRLIESNFVEIRHQGMEKKLTKEIINEKRRLYEWDYIRFHEKMAYLSNKKIILEYVAEFYNPTFSNALMYLEKSLDKNVREKSYSELYSYTSKRNIETTNYN